MSATKVILDRMEDIENWNGETKLKIMIDFIDSLGYNIVEDFNNYVTERSSELSEFNNEELE